MTYDLVKRNFNRGLWNAAMVGTAVEKGVIGAEEYQGITGQEYAGRTNESITPDEILNILDGQEG